MRFALLASLASVAAAEMTMSSTSIIATFTQTRTVMRVVTATKKAAVVNSTSSMSYMPTGYSSISSSMAHNTTVVYSTARPTTTPAYSAVATGAAGKMHLDSAIALIVGGAAAMLVL